MRFFDHTHSHTFLFPQKYTHFREGVEYICTYDNIILIRVVDFILYVYFYVYVCVFLLYTALWSLSLFYSRRRRPSFFFFIIIDCVYVWKHVFYFHNAHFYIHYNMFGLGSLSLIMCARRFFISYFSFCCCCCCCLMGSSLTFLQQCRTKWMMKKEEEREREIRWDELYSRYITTYWISYCE